MTIQNISENMENIIEENVSNGLNEVHAHVHSNKVYKEDIYSSRVNKNDEFSQFLAKTDGFKSVFSAKSLQDFFMDVPAFSNPIRKLAKCSEVDSYSGIEVVGLPSISYPGAAEFARREEIKIELVSSYVKAQYSARNWHNINSSFAHMIKLELGLAAAARERFAFAQGLRLDNVKINGLVEDAVIAHTNRADLSADSLTQLIYNIEPQYLDGAVFMMSRATLAKVKMLKDSTNKPLFNDNKTLMGYDVYILDELDTGTNSNIVFGNFGLGYVVCDLKYIDIQKNFNQTNYDKVDIVMPHCFGGALVRQEAFSKLVINAAAAAGA